MIGWKYRKTSLGYSRRNPLQYVIQILNRAKTWNTYPHQSQVSKLPIPSGARILWTTNPQWRWNFLPQQSPKFQILNPSGILSNFLRFPIRLAYNPSFRKILQQGKHIPHIIISQQNEDSCSHFSSWSLPGFNSPVEIVGVVLISPGKSWRILNSPQKLLKLLLIPTSHQGFSILNSSPKDVLSLKN